GADQQLDIDTVREGFATVVSPGRLERVRTAPTVFIDAAHNPHGAQALARTVESEFDFRTLIGVVSVFADKDAVGILTELEPVLDTVVVTHNGSPRALEVERLGAIAEEIFGEDRVVTAPTMVDAVETAVALADQESDDEDPASGVGVLITGSVVTAGAARSLFGKEPQ
ncbi:glutamate ligase domain-containing protein, partial [Tsukamurella strandjordii]